MTGHGQPESGTNIGPAEVSERTLREEFFPPFEKLIKETKSAPSCRRITRSAACRRTPTAGC
jgi:beta-glucosidase-like glycosyl hydrolase